MELVANRILACVSGGVGSHDALADGCSTHLTPRPASKANPPTSNEQCCSEGKIPKKPDTNLKIVEESGWGEGGQTPRARLGCMEVMCESGARAY